MAQEESNTAHGHMGTNYHLHPTPCACDPDESVININQRWGNCLIITSRNLKSKIKKKHCHLILQITTVNNIQIT